MGSRNADPKPTPQQQALIRDALGQIPCGVFVVTAEHEDRRMGMIARWVQQVCYEPPMISVSIEKGRPIMPLISESHRFGVCQLSEEDRLTLRKFSKAQEIGEDPFLGYDLVHGNLHPLPLLAGTAAYLECELTCHMDFEGDHDLFVGIIKGAGYRDDVKPMVRTGETNTSSGSHGQTGV